MLEAANAHVCAFPSPFEQGNGTNAFYKRLGRQSRVGLDMQGHELGGILEDDEPLDLAGGTGYVPPNYDDM